MGAGLIGVGVLGWLSALSVYDVRDRRLPNWLTMPGAVAVLVVAALTGRGVPAVAGALALFTIYFVVHLLAPAAMGAGDVKLAIGTGALTGAFGMDVWTVSAVAAPLLTGVVALFRPANSTVPHGPSMCLSAAAATALAVW